jgi:hypothetical protein
MVLNLVSLGTWFYWRHGSGATEPAPHMRPTSDSRISSTELYPRAFLSYNQIATHKPHPNEEEQS